MGESAAQSKEQELANLKGKVLREILPSFRASAAPKISDGEVQAGVELLFELLAHRLGDDALDAVGDEIVTGLRRWFDEAELVKLADRYEPFCKFVLKVIDPAKFGQLQAEAGNRLSAAKVLKALALVLTAAKFTGHLENVRQRFEDVGTRFVELTTEARSADEYRLLDPLAPAPEAASSSGQTSASKLTDANQVTVIEAEPGAGKTWTLQFLAWQQASGLLDGKPHFHQVPVDVELKLLSRPEQTIEAAVEKMLNPANEAARPIPWNSLLLLVDGVNEVATELQTHFKAELRDLLSRFTKLQLVLAGRREFIPRRV